MTIEQLSDKAIISDIVLLFFSCYHRSMIHLPKVQFVELPIEMEKEFFFNFLFKSDMSKYVTKRHPKLKKILSIKSDIERKKIISDYISEYRKKNSKIIKKHIVKYEKAWKKIEKPFFLELSNIIDMQWPKNQKIIKAYISINSICPRFLDDWSFTMYYNYPDIKEAMEIIMHECCHFLYFEKWKKVFPRMNRNKFESPHIEWQLSEIIAPIILNDTRIQKLLKTRAKFYEEYENIKIGDISIADYFSKLYKANINKTNFENILRKSYKEINNIKIIL